MPDTPTPYDSNQEPETRCVHCPRLLHFDELDRWACRVCEDNALKHIAELATWYPQVSTKLAPAGAGSDNAGHVTGATRTAPLPVSLGALDLLGPGGVATQLGVIEDDWRKTLGWTIAPFRGNAEQAIAVVVPFLLNNVGWACARYQDVAEDLKTIRILHSRVDSLVNGRKEPQLPVGGCPTVTADGVVCGDRLRVSPFAAEIRCGGCGTRWARDQWIGLGAAIQGFPMHVVRAAWQPDLHRSTLLINWTYESKGHPSRGGLFVLPRGCPMEPILVTAKEAAIWTGRPVGTIGRWGSEGRITRYGSRYDLRELPAATDDGPAPAPPLPQGCKAA